MAGQNANVNVTFTSSGAGSVAGDAAMVQAAIDSIHGKTVGVSYESNGATGAVGEARAFDQAMRSSQASAGGLGRETARAAKATSDLGKEAKTAHGHMQGLHSTIGAIATGAASAGSRMGITSGARDAQRELTGANRSINQLESGAARTAVATRAIASSASAGGGSIRDSVIDMQKLEDGTWGVAKGMKAIESGSKSAGKASAGGAGGGVPSWEDILRERDAQPKESPRQSGPSPRSPYAERLAASRAAAAAASQEESGRRAARGSDEAGKSAQKASGHVMSLGHAFGVAQNAGWQLAMVGGMMAGVTGEAVSLTKATVGMGLNFDGMAAGITRAEQSAARSHNLGLNGLDQELRQSARAMTNELAPAMKDGVGAVKAWEQAKMGAQGDMGPGISQFANTVKNNAGPLQSIMSSLGGAALNLGSDVVSGVSQAAPAFAALGQTIAGNSAGITAGVKSLTEFGVGAAQLGAQALGAFGSTDSAVKDFVQPGGKPGVRNQDINPGNLARKMLMMAVGGPGMALAEAGGSAANLAGGSAGGRVPPGAFDPSKPFSGTLPDGTPGTGDGKAAKPAKTGGYRPSPDAARYSGMSAREIYSSQYEAATGAAPGQPRYSGLGPRGGGSGVGAMPASIASGLGLAGGSAMPSLMSSMQQAVKGGDGGGLAQATQNHVTKAVHSAMPAATAGGQALGGGITSGTAQGVTSTQTVTDTVLIKHAKRMIEVSAGALGVHSPSLEYDYLGRMLPRGLAQGVERESSHAYGAIGGMLSGAQSMASKFSPDYQGVRGPTITMRKKSKTQANFNDPQAAKEAAAPPVAQQQMSAMQYSPAVMDRIQAHNDRAADLRQKIADRHELAKNGWNVDPFVQAGRNSAEGTAQGFDQGQKPALLSVQRLVQRMHNQYTTTDQQNSPSAVYAGFGANSVAGVGVGFAAGTPGVTSTMVASVGTMADVVGGYLSDRGLMAGYAWAENIATGASSQIKKSDYQAQGLANLQSQSALMSLAATGLMSAGAGAYSYKTPGNTPGLVVLPVAAANTGTQNFTVTHNLVHDDGHITQVATQVTLDMFGRVTDAIPLQPSA